MPSPGIQNDQSLFAEPWHQPRGETSRCQCAAPACPLAASFAGGWAASAGAISGRRAANRPWPRVFSRWGLASDLDNVGTRLGTFHGTVVYDAMDLPKKVYRLTITLTGAGMFRR